MGISWEQQMNLTVGQIAGEMDYLEMQNQGYRETIARLKAERVYIGEELERLNTIVAQHPAAVEAAFREMPHAVGYLDSEIDVRWNKSAAKAALDAEKPTEGYNPDFAVPPGETIKEAAEARGISIEDLADRIDTAYSGLTAVIDGRLPISKSFALKLAEELDAPAYFWLNLQAQYDATKRRIKEAADAD